MATNAKLEEFRQIQAETRGRDAAWNKMVDLYAEKHGLPATTSEDRCTVIRMIVREESSGWFGNVGLAWRARIVDFLRYRATHHG